MVENSNSQQEPLRPTLARLSAYIACVLGVILLISAIISQDSSMALCVSGLALLGGSAVVLSYWRLRSGSCRSSCSVDALRAKFHLDHRARLDLLAPILKADHDPRSESVCRNIESFEEVFGDKMTWANKLSPQHAEKIISSVHDQFGLILDSLDTFLDLWKRALRISDADDRRPFLEQRNKIMGDVQDCVDRLSRTMVYIQRLGTDEESAAELARIEKELDENLAAAHQMEKNARGWTSPLVTA